MWELDHKEGWVPKNDAFELWCWRRLLRVPWASRRSNQSILKEINPEYSLEGLMLKLHLQYFSHMMGRANSLEKTLMLGKIEGKRRRGWQKMSWLDGIIDSVDMNFSKFQEIVRIGKPGMLQTMGLQTVGHNLANEQQQTYLWVRLRAHEWDPYEVTKYISSFFLAHGFTTFPSLPGSLPGNGVTPWPNSA